MINYLVLPNRIMSPVAVTVPNEEEPLTLNFVVIKGVHNLPEHAYKTAKQLPVYEKGLENVPNTGVLFLGIAEIYEVKHMVLSDLHRYTNILKYFHDQRYNSTYFKLRSRLEEIYDGIIDGEIVTLVFFTPGKGLLDGTTATPKTKQGTKQV